MGHKGEGLGLEFAIQVLGPRSRFRQISGRDITWWLRLTAHGFERMVEGLLRDARTS